MSHKEFIIKRLGVFPFSRGKGKEKPGQGHESTVSPPAVYLTPLRAVAEGPVVASFFYGTVDAALKRVLFREFRITLQRISHRLFHEFSDNLEAACAGSEVSRTAEGPCAHPRLRERLRS
jgi:hypothetical protein